VITVNGGALNVHGTIYAQLGGTGVTVNSGTMSMDGGTIAGSTRGVVNLGGTVSISGGSVAGPYGAGVETGGGSTGISGGSISGDAGVDVGGGTVSISGGSISGSDYGVLAYSGTASITGGSISGGTAGVQVNGGTVNLYGCPLQLDGSHLFGTLQDGTPIDTTTYTLAESNLISTCPPPCTPRLPVITCPLDITAPAEPGACSASVNLVTPTASDNCSSSLPVEGVRNDNQPLTAPFPAGLTITITWTATNAAGSTSCDQRVTVLDQEPPSLTPPAPVTATITDPDRCVTMVDLGNATASDNCGTTWVTNDAPLYFPKGTTIVHWTATDAAHNEAHATQTVTVLDGVAPTLSCPLNRTVPATSASGAPVPFTVSASDKCDTPTVVCADQNGKAVASGDAFPIGTTTVNCTATDAAGNTSSCIFTITVTSPDLSLTGAGPSSVVSGSNLTYSFTVQNSGLDAAPGVALNDALPAGTTLVSATATTGSITAPKGKSNGVTWNVGTLGTNSSATLTLVVKVTAKAGTMLSNTASVSSTSPLDPTPANNSATVTTSVVAKR
jgi:uncharacterized repeat protein (TIGR01451 family)